MQKENSFKRNVADLRNLQLGLNKKSDKKIKQKTVTEHYSIRMCKTKLAVTCMCTFENNQDQDQGKSKY